jgi:Fur family ferric uptake transcriptional regulator
MVASGLTQSLRARGLRVTAQRAVILETLSGMRGHRSAQDVFDRAATKLPGLNLATVYRTLELLYQVGLVDVLTSGTEVQRYTFRDAHHRHAHLVCRRCGQMMEADLGLVERLRSEVEAQSGFLIDDHHLALSGLCADCADLEPAEAHVISSQER